MGLSKGSCCSSPTNIASTIILHGVLLSLPPSDASRPSRRSSKIRGRSQKDGDRLGIPAPEEIRRKVSQKENTHDAMHGMPAQLRGGHDHTTMASSSNSTVIDFCRHELGLASKNEEAWFANLLARRFRGMSATLKKKKSPHLHGARWMGIKHGRWERASDHGGCPILPKLAPLGHFLEG
jgi:hypothetical protein